MRLSTYAKPRVIACGEDFGLPTTIGGRCNTSSEVGNENVVASVERRLIDNLGRAGLYIGRVQSLENGHITGGDFDSFR